MKVRPLMLALVALLVAACRFMPGPTATFQPGVERLPGPGYFHVVGEPARAESLIEIRSVGSDGVESGVFDRFQAGQVIEVDGTAFEGPRGLTVDGVECVGHFQVVQEMVTEVLLRLSDGGCEITVIRIHAVEEPPLDQTGRRSIDQPETSVSGTVVSSNHRAPESLIQSRCSRY